MVPYSASHSCAFYDLDSTHKYKAIGAIDTARRIGFIGPDEVGFRRQLKREAGAPSGRTAWR